MRGNLFWSLAVGLWCGVVVACGSSEGSATLVGTVGTVGTVGAGNSNVLTFAPQSAIFSVYSSEGSSFVSLDISDQAYNCNNYINNTRQANSSALLVTASADDALGNNIAPTAGTYIVSSANSSGSPPAAGTLGYAAADFNFLGPGCTPLLDDSLTLGQSGQLVFSLLTESTATGTFQLSIGSEASHVSGSFSAISCAALGTTAAAASSPNHTCLP